MLTPAQITAGTARLVASQLSASDQETWLSLFRLYLTSAAAQFSTMETDLAAVTDTVTEKTASKLAGTLILIEAMGFSTSRLEGGRLGLYSSKNEKRSLLIRYAFSLLYEVPDAPGAGSSYVLSNVGVW